MSKGQPLEIDQNRLSGNRRVVIVYHHAIADHVADFHHIHHADLIGVVGTLANQHDAGVVARIHLGQADAETLLHDPDQLRPLWITVRKELWNGTSDRVEAVDLLLGTFQAELAAPQEGDQELVICEGSVRML